MNATAPIPYRLLFDDGTVKSVVGYCVVGRRPSLDNIAEDLDGSDQVELVKITDPTRSLSRTHCALGQFDDVLWVTDLGSNNGTMLVYPNGSTHRLKPRMRYELDPGCVIRAGTHTIAVLW